LNISKRDCRLLAVPWFKGYASVLLSYSLAVVVHIFLIKIILRSERNKGFQRWSGKVIIVYKNKKNVN
jgi:hypothetical protein